MKKKVLCLIDCLGPGGAQRQIVGLAKLLSMKGYAIEVLTYHNLPFYKKVLDRCSILNYSVLSTRNILFRLFLLWRAMKRFSPDILIAYQEMPSLLACMLKLFMPSVKLIVSERNTTQNVNLIDRVRFFLYRWSDYVVPNSYAQADFLARNYAYLANRIRVITNFVDMNKFIPRDMEHHVIPVISIVASERKEKNFHRFVDSILLLKKKGVLFLVRWYGINKMFIDEYRNYVKERNVDDRMVVFLPQKEIQQVYQCSDFFCLPSLYEGFPNVLCEAMSCGLPVVASNVCDNPIIVKDGVNGFLFNPYSSVDMANKIEMLLRLDKKIILQIQKANRLKSKELFSEESFMSKYVDLIES